MTEDTNTQISKTISGLTDQISGLETEKGELQQSYMKLVHGPNYEIPRRVYPKDFIGPGSYTLQMENILELYLTEMD